MRWVVAACALALIASFALTYAAVNTMCDDLPDWP